MKIKTIDIICKTWFDKFNGNSYFSCKVILNYGMTTEKEYYIPYQYGYGDQYEYETLKSIAPNYKSNLYNYCHAHKIILRTAKESALKRVVKNLLY